MSAQNNLRTKKNSVKHTEPNYSLILIVLVIIFIPLIVRYYEYASGLDQFPWYPDRTTYEGDLFLYWKGRILIVLAVIMTVVGYEAYT